jgi:putative ABC transport system permease protein
LNQTAIKETGIKEPDVGKAFTFHGVKGRIVGVVKDFHFQDMHTQIHPLLIQYDKNWRGKAYLRTTGGDAAKAIAAVQSLWKEYNPEYDFDYNILDREFGDLYKNDAHIELLFNFFPEIATLISCLGLFGLITFTAETKVKEIGVRKVLGAGMLQIIMLLTKEFLMLVPIAAAIGFPFAWYGLISFMQGYACRTKMSWWAFTSTGALTPFVALFSVIFRCIQAALANTVRSLRSE